MYKKQNKYKKIDLEVINQTLINISDDHNDYDDIHFLLGQLHQVNFTKFEFWSNDQINDLLNRHNIDVSVFEKEPEVEKSNTDIVYNKIIDFVTINNGEYKRELIQYLRINIEAIPKGKISSTLRRLNKIGVLEIKLHETSKQKIISKGRYWDSHIGKGGN